jgi:hypothetical protein
VAEIGRPHDRALRLAPRHDRSSVSKATNFAAFKTYAWVRGTPLTDELNHRRIVDAVDAQLASKGLARVEAGGTPDVLVAYHATFDRSLQIDGFAAGWGGYRFGPSRSSSARVEKILTGTLVVDMVDAATNTIVWRGIASKDVDVKASPEKREKNIQRTVAKLYKRYPPKR